MNRYFRISLALLVFICFANGVQSYEGYDMGVFSRLFSKNEISPQKEANGYTNLAFVLLSEARLPDADAIVLAFREFAGEGESPHGEEVVIQKEETAQVISFQINSGEKSFVALVPMAVPNGEADYGAQYSLSSFGNNWALPPHSAHILVFFNSASESPSIVQLSRFTSLVAAVTKASPSVGVYWGNAGATHDSEFFTSIASSQGIVPRIVLWSGVSVDREADGRLSLLSLGMKQLNLPDLLLIAGKSSESVALETMYDLLAYVAERGEALAEGDTVGRTADERLTVSYVRSPVDASTMVWRVELP